MLQSQENPEIKIQNDTISEDEPEVWKNMKSLGFTNYSASNFGTIRNDVTGKILKVSKNSKGYNRISLPDDSGKEKNLAHHRLIALTFLGEPVESNASVDHINRDRSDNKLSNLRWATSQEQAQNKSHFNGKLPKKVEQCNSDGTLITLWNSRQEAAKELNISVSGIAQCCRGNTDNYKGFLWRDHILKPEDEEIWKCCVDPNFAGFSVSSLGRVRTPANTISYGAKSGGYKMVYAPVDGVTKCRAVHSLIAECFLGEQDLFVNHKDGDKSNNVLENLEYVTQSQNTQHAFDIGLHPGQTAVIKCHLDGTEIERYQSIVKAEKAIGRGNIRAVLDGRTKTAGGFIWKRVKDEPINQIPLGFGDNSTNTIIFEENLPEVKLEVKDQIHEDQILEEDTILEDQIFEDEFF